MAETSLPVCEAREDGGTHCWHMSWVQYAAWRELVTQSYGMVCCWCGVKKPLELTYQPIIPHGKHLPAVPPQPRAVAGAGTIGTIVHAPFFGVDGIPTK